jgi:predicted dehydrogenase
MTPSRPLKPTSKPLAGALIGFGAVAEKAHAPAWLVAADFRITAIAEANASRRKVAGTLFPKARLYSGHAELLAKEKNIDFVDIATPPFLHATQIRAALDAGMHVLCEKPLVMNVDELTQLNSLAEKKDRALFAIHNWKYAPLFQKLRALIASGMIGNVRHCEWHVLRTRPSVTAPKAGANWRTDNKKSGGGILMDHGWHAIYLLSWLANSAPKSASGILRRPTIKSAEEEVTALLEFPESSGLFHLTWGSPTRGHWGMIYGEEGRIAIEDDRLVTFPKGTEGASYVFPEALSAGSAHPDWFAAMLGDFHAAMQHAKHRKQNLLEAQACAAMIESLYNQARPATKRATHRHV